MLKRSDKIINEVETDRSQFIDDIEFVNETIERNILLNQQKLEAAFNVFDANGSGTIFVDEIQIYLESVKIMIDVIVLIGQNTYSYLF